MHPNIIKTPLILFHRKQKIKRLHIALIIQVKTNINSS